MFLFGARQTGKSTLLKERFKDAIYYDLLNPNLRKAFKSNPNTLWEALQDKPAGTVVIVDEIQKVPELLDVVHSLMVDRGLFFILSGSSSRKLKRSGANTLGGRAIPETLYPLVWPEVTDFQIDRAVQNGMIPRHYMVADATKRLSGYVKVYLDEEIREEGEVRELEAFERFMEVAAISDGEMLNYANIASDCGVSAKTVKSYFQILYDTLIGYEIPAFRKSVKRKVVQAPRFYYFDVGLANYLMGRHSLKRGTDDYGHAFEHLVMQEIVAYKGYNDKRDAISYWHTYDKKRGGCCHRRRQSCHRNQVHRKSGNQTQKRAQSLQRGASRVPSDTRVARSCQPQIGRHRAHLHPGFPENAVDWRNLLTPDTDL